MSITDEVRTQNAPLLLRRALTNRDHGGLAWFFVTDEWDTDQRPVPVELHRPPARGHPVAVGAGGGPRGLRLLRGPRGAPGRQDPRPAPRAARGQRRPPGPGGRGPRHRAPGRSVNARRTHRLPRMEIWPGEPFPWARPSTAAARNFSLFSEVAERVELCLFDEDGNETRVDLPEVTAFVLARLPARRPARASATASACTARGPRSRAAAATRPSCCSTRTPRPSRAASSGTRRSSRYRSTTAPTARRPTPTARRSCPKSRRGQPVLRLGRRPPPAAPVARDRHLRDARQGLHHAPPGHPRGAARHLRRPGASRRSSTTSRASASPRSSCMPVHQFVHDNRLVERGAAQLLGLQLHRLLRAAQRVRVVRPARASRCRSSSRW